MAGIGRGMDGSGGGVPIKTVTSFKYLGSLLNSMDDVCKSVIVNLQKVQSIWYQLYRILWREGVSPKTSGIF